METQIESVPDLLTVAVIDDHQIVADGVQLSLERGDLEARVVYASSVRDLPPQLGAPVVAALDLRLLDGSTPKSNLEELRQRAIPAVIFTSADDPFLVRQAIAAGALAVVRKSESPKVLVDALLSAAKGEASAGLDWAAAVDSDHDFVKENLTRTETDVLALYASGEASKWIARRLSISIHTVNKAVSNIREKYRNVGRAADSRVDLFRRAAEDGLVSYFDDPPFAGEDH